MSTRPIRINCTVGTTLLESSQLLQTHFCCTPFSWASRVKGSRKGIAGGASGLLALCSPWRHAFAWITSNFRSPCLKDEKGKIFKGGSRHRHTGGPGRRQTAKKPNFANVKICPIRGEVCANGTFKTFLRTCDVLILLCLKCQIGSFGSLLKNSEPQKDSQTGLNISTERIVLTAHPEN